jgi:hypothetical protein
MFNITIRPTNIFNTELILLLCLEYSAYEKSEYNFKDKLESIYKKYFRFSKKCQMFYFDKQK